ncbi:MAG TPA: universal stress protein [Polyangiaceae bacterium]|jgi:nucleotide-binding universal stress UspA family protein|nr:universal stress protein [Polyangiaceae bacterium]
MKPQDKIEHILVAHDLGECSDDALAYAIQLAKQLHAKVTVLHAYEVPSMGAPERLVLATDWVKQIGVVAGEKLEEVVSRGRALADGGVVVASALVEGSAWREVGTFARERGVNLVVVGSRGHRALLHALLGGVAEKIVRTAPCPVLVVRDDT